MPTIDETYETTEPAPVAEALSQAATAIRKAFTTRANKHGTDDAEARRLMAAHKAIIALRKNYESITE